MNNPLIAAYRKPAVYISLPSEGKYYKNKPKLSVDNELAIFPMTARDELVTKTPDALFNGEATVSMINSCCPDIQDPNEMPVNDLMAVLIGIRIASYGSDIDIDAQCPSCEHMNQLSVNSNAILATLKPNETPEVVELANGFRVKCKPYTLRDRTTLQVQQIKQRKLIESLSDAKLSDEEREAKFGKTFVELADITVGLIANCIDSVMIPEDETIDDVAQILEWLKSITKKDYDSIKLTVESLSNSGVDSNFNAKCQSCGHDWKTNVDLDMANFFVG
jgi:hypothetical protein